MDINAINPHSTAQANQPKADFPVMKKSDVEAAPVKVAAVEKSEAKKPDEKRYEQVERAAKVFFNDVFVVNDTKFTIFKDTSGQFVTRFTNLRDGSVTYIPEPEILRYMESRGRARESLIEIEA